MNDAANEQDLARDHQRYKQLLRSVVMAFVISLVVGLLGGYLVYLFLPAGKFPVFVLYLPGLLAVLLTCLPIRKRKKKWFPTQESLMAASQYKPPE